jgi:hypothetical protein
MPRTKSDANASHQSYYGLFSCPSGGKEDACHRTSDVLNTYTACKRNWANWLFFSPSSFVTLGQHETYSIQGPITPVVRFSCRLCLPKQQLDVEGPMGEFSKQRGMVRKRKRENVGVS